MITDSMIVDLFPRIRHTCFTFFDGRPFLIGVELQAFDRMYALAGRI